MRDRDVFKRARYIRDVLAFEVSRGGDVVVIAEKGGSGLAERGIDLIEVPNEKLSFMAFGVCVLR